MADTFSIKLKEFDKDYHCGDLICIHILSDAKLRRSIDGQSNSKTLDNLTKLTLGNSRTLLVTV